MNQTAFYSTTDHVFLLSPAPLPIPQLTANYFETQKLQSCPVRKLEAVNQVAPPIWCAKHVTFFRNCKGRITHLTSVNAEKRQFK